MGQPPDTQFQTNTTVWLTKAGVPPNSLYYPPSNLAVGGLSLNTISFNENIWVNGTDTSITYQDTTYINYKPINYQPPFIWVVGGNSYFQGFSFTNTNDFPQYTGYTLLPDTVDLYKGVYIPLKSYKGVDRIEVFLHGGGGNGGMMETQTKAITPAHSGVYFSGDDLLSPMLGTSWGEIFIAFYRDNYQTINGRVYNFRTGLIFIKSVYVKQ
ncbi:MAG: hypothetical protein JST26_09665 [Bacteroidetes bacterium]|nr:hypothetical protein [Bacteroidota bacterium]